MYTVTIGIPAYNEEANIKVLVLSLLQQESSNFILTEIIIVSDGSSDKTAKQVVRLTDKRITFLENKVRLGQALTQEVIRKRFAGDILVLLNADILIDGRDFIAKMVEPFYSNTKLGIVSCRVTPLKARSFFESVINFSVAMKQEAFSAWNQGNNIYMCHGRARAFGSKFIKAAAWRQVVAEDAYMYLTAKTQGYDFFYLDSAQIYYQSPVTFRDHFSQSYRFSLSTHELVRYFPKAVVNASYAIPKKLLVTTALSYLIKNPVYLVYYGVVIFIVQVYARLFPRINPIWNVAHSSKQLPAV